MNNVMFENTTEIIYTKKHKTIEGTWSICSILKRYLNIFSDRFVTAVSSNYNLLNTKLVQSSQVYSQSNVIIVSFTV